jgi:hypothetical protein
MKAELLMRERLTFSRRAFVDIVVWKVPKPLPESRHSIETPYVFSSIEKLQADFWSAVNKRRKRR